MGKFREGSNNRIDLLEELAYQGLGEVGKTPMTGAGSFEEVTVGDTAGGLTVPSGAGSAMIMVEGDSGATDSGKVVRFKENGTPTANEGLFLGNGDILEVPGAELSTIEFIAATATEGATLQVQYYESYLID